MFSPEPWVHEMEGFFPAVEAILNERAKNPVFFVDAVKESTNMPLPA
jgi:hypothetical protein